MFQILTEIAKNSSWRLTSLMAISAVVIACKIYTDKNETTYIKQREYELEIETEKEKEKVAHKSDKVNNANEPRPVVNEGFKSIIPKYLKESIASTSTNTNNVPPIPQTPKIFTKDYNITYINPDSGYEIFNVGTHNNTYLETMNMVNIHARGYNNKALCIAKYMESLDIIQTNERKSINKFINSMIEKIIASMRLTNTIKGQYASTTNSTTLARWVITTIEKTKLAKGNQWLEDGMPHTHNNIIFFPPNWFDEITSSDSNDDAFKSDKIFFYNAGTLMHELIHIHQRFEHTYHLYTELYQKWGFVKARYIDNIETLLVKNRHNPDGVDPLWIWCNPTQQNEQPNKQYYWIGAIFKSVNPLNLSDVDLVAYPVSKISDTSFKLQENQPPQKLSEFADFQAYFQLNNNNYHPNEIVAGYMEIYYQSLIGLRGHLNYPGYKEFQASINKIIKL